MTSVIRPIVHGAVAGLAGTTALNMAGYVDIVLRGRPISDTPEITVRSLAEKLHVRIPGDDEIRENRVAGLGPLMGYTVGMGMGVALSLVQAAGLLPTKTSRYAFASVFALTVTNVPIFILGISDPRTWTAADWVSDIIPHGVFAVVTVGVIEKLEAAGSRV
ncbi:hypothetical protein ACFCYI_06285 [Streptomyces sp. NPDC056257]|uniref:hypothetical protein n=1 Tax=Streptomyces sp. NPDC056257 TaxID=3345765 RepID=UPI0035D8FD2C